MLIDRGYRHDALEELSAYQKDEIVAILNNKPLFTIKLNKANILILYVLSSKARLVDIRKQLEVNEDFTGNHILVIKDKMNSADQKKLQEIKEFEIFQLHELQFNISKHELVPKHEVIRDEEEIKIIIDMYQLKSKHQMPIILKTDPMARYLNAKSGNLVKITRISPTCGINIDYRCCV
jgi:DNA-directed RNA polymerase I, II, and III subunit RPABC1